MKTRITNATFALALAGSLLLGGSGYLGAADPEPKDHTNHQDHKTEVSASGGGLPSLNASLVELRKQVDRLRETISRGQDSKAADPAQAGMNMGMQGMKSGMQMGMKGMSMGKMGGGSMSGMNMSGSDSSSGGMNMGMGKMKGMSMMSGGSMSGMNMSGSDSSSSGMNMGMGMMKGMGMMDMMKKKGMGMGMMGMMKGMNMMGMAPEQTQKSALPGFPGASHIYHIGAADFFLDHADHVKLTREQTGKLNRIKEKTALAKATADRKIAEAEQQLWQLTASDQPEAAKIEAKIREIEKLGGDRRLELIRAVGEAAKVLTHEQHQMLTGHSDSAAEHSGH